MKAKFYLMFAISLLNSLTSRAVDCPSLPSDEIIVSQLRAVGKIKATVAVNLLDKNYTCQSQGTTHGSYRSLSIIARYTLLDQNQTAVSDRISQFELTCTDQKGWIGNDGSLAGAPDGFEDLETKKNCLSCSSNASNDHHCNSCHSSCLRRCTGQSEADCCDVFSEGVCAKSCPTINQVAIEANDYACQNITPCDPPCVYGTCEKSAGVCRCYDGLTGRSCSDDINECASGNGGCPHNCRNTFGSFMCSCGTGYKPRENGFICHETIPCDPPCVYGTCNRSAGVCQCFKGLTRRNCTDDVDECANENGGCSHNCTNTFGGFTCSCRAGYELSEDGLTCQETKSCDPPCIHGTCNESAGVCQCFEGIKGRRCSDDNDECAIGNGGCPHTCTNTFGSFKCSCRAGYILSEDGLTCQEIIPCDPPCVYGICDESAGVCQCYDGLTGKSCNDDIDECVSGNCSHACKNTFGSFMCSCRAGHELSEDRVTCQDIDECASGNGGCLHTCRNTDGHFMCSCRTGYELKKDGHTFCQETTPCDPPCVYGKCDRSAGVCQCFKGLTGRNCTDDINECASGNGGCSHNCANTFGSFKCSCKTGYTLSSDGFRCQALIGRLPKVSGPCSARGRRYYYNSTSKECEQFEWGGCGGNANRFLFKHTCEEECNECPPTCSPELCVTDRSAICTVPEKKTDGSCPGGCVVSNCLACVYHDVPLPSLPTSCPALCTTPRHKDCMREWGRCLRQYFYKSQRRIPLQRNEDNYKCWEYPC